MIPFFEKSGLLPSGVHYAAWDELVKKFGVNKHRLRLLEGLKQGLNLLIEYGCKEACINGSFVTAKVFPGDIDVCYDNTYMNWKKFTKEHPEFVDVKNGAVIMKQKYGCEFYAYNAFEDDMLRIFQFDKNNNPKGIVKLTFTARIP